MQYPRILEIRISGDIEADNFADELAEKCREKDITKKVLVEELDIVVKIELESYEDFAVIDNCLAGLVQEYLGKVCVEVE
jgi:hypothetical protein